MGPLAWAAKKIGNKEKVEHALYEHWHRPLKNMDERAGKALADAGIFPNAFRQVDVLPSRRNIGGHRALIEHETHSLTGPITKATKTVTPVLAALALGHIAGKLQKESQVEDIQTKGLLKEAADKIASFELREQSVKLAFQMVERGKCPPFKTLNELEEKVASIIEKDPKIVEQALALEPMSADLGTLSQEKTASAGGSPELAFFHRLSEA